MAVLNVRNAIRDKGLGGNHGISLQFPSGLNPLSLGSGKVYRSAPSCSLPSLTKSQAQEIDSKGNTPGAGSHDSNGSLPFVPCRSRMDNSQAVGDFELGRVSS